LAIGVVVSAAQLWQYAALLSIALPSWHYAALLFAAPPWQYAVLSLAMPSLSCPWK
jgi:hypothetical protein